MHSFMREKQIENYISSGDFDAAGRSLLEALDKNPGSIGLLKLMLRLLENVCDSSWLDTAEDMISNAVTAWFRAGIDESTLLSLLSIFNSRLMKLALRKNIHPIKDIKQFKLVERPKILILTCLWKRLELTKEFLKYYSVLKDYLEPQLELDLLAVGSEGELTQKLVERYGFSYVEAPNKPLSDKWQKGLTFAQNIDFDAIVILGSDDFLDKKTFLTYKKMLQKRVIFFGFYDAYIYDSGEKDLMYWPGYGDSNSKMPHRTGETVGMGRMLHRNVLEILNFDLWKGIQVNSSLDGYAQKKLKKSLMLLPVYNEKIDSVPELRGNKIAQVGGKLKLLDLFAVDIKGKSNVTDPNALRKISILDDYAISKQKISQNLGIRLANKFENLTDVKVSIIILAHKESEFLHKAIKTALSQNFDYEYEIILASDSEPNLRYIADEYGIIFSLSEKQEKNTSCSKNLNDAVALARGEFIKLAAYDDFMPDDCIQSLYEAAVKDDASLVFANAYEYYSDQRIKEYKPKAFNITIESQAERNAIHGGTIMFNRKDFLLVGGLNENIIYAEEFHFYFKLLSLGLKFTYLDRFVYYYRRHEAQKGTLSLSAQEKERKSRLVSDIGKKYLETPLPNHLFFNNKNYFLEILSKKKVVGIATIESRKTSLLETVKSIYNQVDIINIYQNGYKDVGFIKDPSNKINIVSSLDTGIDKGDAGKFYFLDNFTDCLYFSMDDDLIYPDDYISRSINSLIRSPEATIFTYHGKIFRPNAKDWFRDILINVRCTNEYGQEHDVQFGGTGVMFFDTSRFPLKFNDFKMPNMADVFVGLRALETLNRIRALAHDSGWISVTKAAQNDLIANSTIYRTRRRESVATQDLDESKYLRHYYSLLNPVFSY